MAYYTTASSFSQRVGEISNNLASIDINSDLAVLNTNNGKISLKQARDNAAANVSKFLTLLGYDSDPKTGMVQLNAAIQRFHQTTTAFNGLELRARVIEPLRGKVINTANLERKKFEALIEQNADELPDLFWTVVQRIATDLNLMDGLMSGDSKALTAITNELFAQLNFNITWNLNTGAVSVSGAKVPKGGQILDKELAKNITSQLKAGIQNRANPNFLALIYGSRQKNFRNRLVRLAQERGIQVDWLIEQNIAEPVVNLTSSDTSLTLYYDLITPYMNKMTPIGGTIAEKSAREYFKTHPEEVASLYKDAESYFLQFLNTGMLAPNESAKLTDNFKKALHSILDNYPAAFFTGRNDNAIIGIFGELQGMYYIYSILGENSPQLSPEDISWIGGDTTAGSGAKTGADIVARIGQQLGFGIQVKNSMELTRSTGFSDFVLSNDSIQDPKGFLGQLTKLGIDPQIATDLEELFTMKSFNIGYRLQGTHAVAGSPLPIAGTDIYESAYNQLDGLIEQANKLMALAAAAIMRIQYAEGMDFQETNTLWLIGGTAMVSSIQILNDLINQIDGINTNQLVSSVATKLGDTGYTIVDYINGAGGISNLKTVLSTSYNFHKTSSL